MEPVHAVQSLVALRTLRTLIAVVTLRTLRAVVAAIAVVALRALRSHPAVVAAITLRASGAVRALAVEHVARAVPIHVLGLEVAVTVLIQVPAIHSVHALRAGVAFRPLRTGYSGVTGHSWVAFHSQRTGHAGVALHSQRTGYARVAFRARRPARALWPGRPDGTDRSRGTVRARCAHPRRRRHGHLSLDAGREPEMDLRVFQLAAVVHERAGRLGLRGGAPADAGHREHCERQGQFARLHAIYPFSFV